MGRFGDRSIGRFGDRDVGRVHVAILGPFLDDMIRMFGSISAYKIDGATTRPRPRPRKIPDFRRTSLIDGPLL